MKKNKAKLPKNFGELKGDVSDLFAPIGEYKITPDPIYYPIHYTQHPSGVEPITITEHMGFCLGNAIKYIMRCELKGNKIEDLKKAIFYIEREIKRCS